MNRKIGPFSRWQLRIPTVLNRELTQRLKYCIPATIPEAAASKIIENTHVVFSLLIYFCFLAHLPTAHSVTLGDISAQPLPLPLTQHRDPRTQMLKHQLTPVPGTGLQADRVSLITISHVSRTSLFTPNTPHDIQRYTRNESN